MTVFKGYMRIMKKNTGLILLYLGIFFGVTMALQAAAGKETYTSYESEKIKIGVVDKDNGPLAEGLVKWLEGTHHVTMLEDNREKLQEELFYRNVEYIVVIPEDFYENCMVNGESISVTKVPGSYSAYATVFNRALEKDISSDEMAHPAIGMMYSKVIFVGDSRTAGIQATLKKQMSSSVTNGVSFVANPGKGLSWFRDTGYAQLIEEIDKTEGSKPIAVIFNLGVNDLGNAGNYVSYMTSIASTLKSKNCKLFYMSVNPINSTMITKAGRGARTEAQVREFNSKIRSGLSLDYKYIDMYSVLMKKGYGTNASYNGTDADSHDGLHYTTKTFKRIYYYCITYLNTGSINASYY